MNLFKKPDPKELQRANDRQIRKTGRDLTSDHRQLERREKELEIEIKKLAAKGQIDACKILAKQLVQIRSQKTKNVAMNAKITSIGAQAKTMNSMGTMTKAMGTAAQTMKAVDKQMPLQKFAADMREFQMTNDKMELKEEVINDTLDNLFEVDEGEQQFVIDQVLDEIGIETMGKMPAVPSGSTGLTAKNKEVTDADIERMLAALKS
uniref:Uncharacterized protein n=1 Tax=Panagrolaimus sp. JU765 TaxID=591449 RepID=A0AC34QNB5_9BILA